MASIRLGAFGPHWTARHRRADGLSVDVMIDLLPDGGCTIAVNDITLQTQAEDDARNPPGVPLR